MWECQKCGRIFEKEKQIHSCNKFPLEKHFKNKRAAREIFDHLVKVINNNVGPGKIISLPCCIHLFGKFDFLAALPKKDRLEIRFSLYRILDSPRLKVSVPVSAKAYKNCIDLRKKDNIDKELIDWLKEAYYLKD